MLHTSLEDSLWWQHAQRKEGCVDLDGDKVTACANLGGARCVGESGWCWVAAHVEEICESGSKSRQTLNTRYDLKIRRVKRG